MLKANSPDEKLLQDVFDQFWENFPPAWNRIRNHIRSIAAEDFDITVEQFHILRHIHKGIVSVSDLAAERQISRSAISQVVDTLVSKGLTTRREHPEDRRYIVLALTPEGRDMLQAVYEKNHAWMMTRLARLTADECETLIQGLVVLRKAFDDSTLEYKEKAPL